MDPLNLVRVSLLSLETGVPDNTRIARPRLQDKPAASTPNGNIKLKGIIVGGLTGGIEICISYPTDYVKTQLQLDGKTGSGSKFSGIWDCVTKTVKSRGIFGLYRGLSVVINGSVCKLSVRFGAFETIRQSIVDENGKLSPYRRFLAGLGAGLCEAVLVVTPIDTIKVKFINDQRSANPKFRGLIHGVKTIIKENGFKGVYKGLVPTMIKQGSNQATRFFTVETLKDWYVEGDATKKVPKPIIAAFGAIAGAASALGNTPVDVVKTRMQSLEASKYKNTWDCAVQLWKIEGPMSFYKGLVPRLTRVSIEVSITFVVYDSIMELFNKFWP